MIKVMQKVPTTAVTVSGAEICTAKAAQVLNPIQCHHWHSRSADYERLHRRLGTSSVGQFQITTNGFAPYRSAVTYTLGHRVDFAQQVKVYRATPEGECRYSPAEVVSTEVVPVCGQPNPDKICTSHVERSNRSLRISTRRFTRLTNAFSKKWENHCAAVMLCYCWYNFGRVHKTLRVTPAMQAGISDHVWTVRELLEAA